MALALRLLQAAEAAPYDAIVVATGARGLGALDQRAHGVGPARVVDEDAVLVAQVDGREERDGVP